MDLTGTVCVVTGGQSGIGAALVDAFRANSARVVVSADITAGADVHCDVGDPASIDGLVQTVERDHGPIDLFFANAGIGLGAGPETPDEDWDRIWRINTMHHVWAARSLLPGWLARGHGYFGVTASAAGLLGQIGSAPYTVTKHAAVAFAEWMSITYGDQGVRVSCLCPQGVNTPLLGADAASAVVRSAGVVLEPDVVAQCVVDAITEERFLVLPHPEVAEYEQRKVADRDRWIRGMRRLQAKAAVGE
jgi:NAD(P)-dependent dehydrogenase (short-subunit alcohol dehydrogenase family)